MTLLPATLHRLDLRKPDGRALWLYGRRPLDPATQATAPSPEPVEADPRLRWHPVRGEWVAYASHRQHRTFKPPAAFNPLAPTPTPPTRRSCPPATTTWPSSRTSSRRLRREI